MALTIRLRNALPEDAVALAGIEQESFPDPSWTAEDFLKYDCTVAEIETANLTTQVTPHIGGFLVSRETYPGATNVRPEREILNLAVAAEYRRLGIARALLENELERSSEVFLEVREGNERAIQLYKNAGFIEVSRRLAYYDNPVECAIVMRTK